MLKLALKKKEEEEIVKIFKAIDCIYGKTCFTHLIEQTLYEELSIVHLLTKYRYYNAVAYLVSNYDYDFYFYKLYSPLHVIAKFHLRRILECEEESVMTIFRLSIDFTQRDSTFQSILTLAKENQNMNVFFIRQAITKAIEGKMRALSFIIDHALRKRQTTLNKYIIRDIYKYLDG